MKYSDDLIDFTDVLFRINKKISKKIKRTSHITQLDILAYYTEELQSTLKKELEAKTHKLLDPTDIVYINLVTLWMCYTAKDQFTDPSGNGARNVETVLRTALKKFRMISKLSFNADPPQHTVVDVKDIFLRLPPLTKPEDDE